jgi:hypothetical protein
MRDSANAACELVHELAEFLVACYPLVLPQESQLPA